MKKVNIVKLITAAMKPTILFFALSIVIISCSQPENSRNQIDLNGEWKIAKTDTFTVFPSSFESKAPVPGLVDLAKPALDTGRTYDGGIYWYKTGFTIDRDYPERVQLEIGKAKYHTRVYLNGRFVGEHVYCFTPGRFDVRSFLNPPGEENELLIGVGVVKNIPDTVIWGHDFEKLTYIPGIYDNVSLVLSGYPFIKNIQTVPVIDEEKVRIVADIDNDGKNGPVKLEYVIRELTSGEVVAEGKAATTDFAVSLPGCQLWTPGSPFLYELELSTGADSETVRFGMRSFSFEPKTKRAILNGKPYFMRGTNVCIFRFFEDPDRSTLPWDEDWVIRLHQQFKNMHWNSIRYCIGLPPERWYEIADSLGFLIQNEYPVWTGGPGGFDRIYPNVTAEHLANEYRAWLPEQWNHASVVIWDAQNECVTDITGKAIGMVRDIDLSNRPWENGWSAPQAETDPVESHPYLFSRYRGEGKPSEKGPLADLLSEFQIPGNDASRRMPPEDGGRYPNPLIINEYAWLWLNRDGSTTTLTDEVYDNAFGENLTKEEQIYLYCRHLGMLTEYWRTHRYCAGVLHFCGLAYSRPEEPRGQTSDHFIDIKNLTYEPQFVEYVKPAFAPVGLMINFWNKTAAADAEKGIEIYAVNDLYDDWQGKLTLQIQKGEEQISSLEREITIPALRREILNFDVEMPSEKGEYRLIAEISLDGEAVKSIREFSVE
jgi:beta-galactosidase